MRWNSVAAALLTVGSLTTLPAVAVAQLDSVQQAETLSKKTGRPIFAMAGNKT